jgi:hypothetical protein
MSHEHQTPLQELEVGPFHDSELGILDMTSIDGIKTAKQLTEVINTREF